MALVVGVVDTAEGAHVGVWEFFVAVDVPVHGVPGTAGVGVFAPRPGLDDGQLEVAGSGEDAAGVEIIEFGVDDGVFEFEFGFGVKGDCCCCCCGAEGGEEEYEGN